MAERRNTVNVCAILDRLTLTEGKGSARRRPTTASRLSPRIFVNWRWLARARPFVQSCCCLTKRRRRLLSSSLGEMSPSCPMGPFGANSSRGFASIPPMRCRSATASRDERSANRQCRDGWRGPSYRSCSPRRGRPQPMPRTSGPLRASRFSYRPNRVGRRGSRRDALRAIRPAGDCAWYTHRPRQSANRGAADTIGV